MFRIFAARIITSSRKYDHVTPLLKSLKWLPVKSQLYFKDAILGFKCISSRAPKYLSEQFVTRSKISKRATRNFQMLDIPLYKTSAGQRTFYYRTVDLWNRLEQSMKFSKNVDTFKYSLRSTLLHNFMNS